MEALSIISSAKFYIGNDTGLTHMATMARVPTLAIVGGAYPGRDFPYPEGVAPHLTAVVNLPPCKSCGWRCGSKIGDLAKCIHDISLERVLASIEWF
jgi:ADP-heptose:LPS heptosyltransferase